MSPRVKVVIPFRDRGIDPRRQQNLDVVLAWWWAHGFDPVVQADGGEGNDQFNRHRAYNAAVERFPETDVFVFTEADMLIHPDQITQAVHKAAESPGLVVPFHEYRYLADLTTEAIRQRHALYSAEALAEWWALPPEHPSSVFRVVPESTMGGGRSIGAVNVVSRETLRITGGFTEMTQGNWYDDRIIEEGFAFLAAPTRWVSGSAVHLYHLPGWKGDHLTDEDRRATEFNRQVLTRTRLAIQRNDKEDVRYILAKRREQA